MIWLPANNHHSTHVKDPAASKKMIDRISEDHLTGLLSGPDLWWSDYWSDYWSDCAGLSQSSTNGGLLDAFYRSNSIPWASKEWILNRVLVLGIQLGAALRIFCMRFGICFCHSGWLSHDFGISAVCVGIYHDIGTLISLSQSTDSKITREPTTITKAGSKEHTRDCSRPINQSTFRPP
ncbi:hypothetical protein BC833DRAFT_639423 [Globomyces pollinis-pini]|nr:hypothetical protein BC833DRAFT_639423 [Globomyces pollinis-pini]